MNKKSPQIQGTQGDHALHKCVECICNDCVHHVVTNLEKIQIKTMKMHARFPNAFQYKVLLFQQPFVRKFSVKLWSRIYVTILGIRMGVDGCKWYQLKCWPTFLFDFITHHGPILHRLATTRQTGRSEFACWLCLKTEMLHTYIHTHARVHNHITTRAIYSSRCKKCNKLTKYLLENLSRNLAENKTIQNCTERQH